jgi:hypothetical protein
MGDGKANTADMIDLIADEVNSILNKRQKERYFDSVMLLYSVIENLLKWIVYTDIVWEKYSKKILRVTKNARREEKEIHRFCKRLSFHNALRIALARGWLDYRLYKKVEEIRVERNNVVHQLWIYHHRHNRLVIRKKLEKLALVTNDLVGVLNGMVKRIGVDEILDLL